ncbi:hypothetical protein FRC19_003769 [Serendipita sp. 401]|nr:hypothetical protein FRC19_003769 [Serendipita sp. 401]
MKWDSNSIDVWFFYRVAVPDDINQGLPDPSRWPLPSASISSVGCPIDNYFRNHVFIFGRYRSSILNIFDRGYHRYDFVW